MVRRMLDALGCRSFVEFGVGGGHTISHLVDHYDCFAVDLSESMLAQCRKLNPGLATEVGDMRTVRLGRAFDAAMIHDAIDYMTTPDDVQRTLATVAAHLSPGGLALIAPTYTTETFTDGETEHDEHDGLAYDATIRRTGDTTFDLVMTYHTNDASIEDVHRCGLFPRSFWLDAMHDAGFDAEHTATDIWELFTGIRLE